MTAFDRQRLGSVLAASGAVLGMVAGAVQASVGSDIPAWSGSKAAPGALGVLTIVLSAVAGIASRGLRRPDPHPGGRLLAVAALVVPALVGFTTVGRLWLVPGTLLLIGAALSIASLREAGALTRRNWIPVLLAALGCFELLMAAGAAPEVMAVGVIGGVGLIATIWAGAQRRGLFVGLVVVGTVPFALIAWTAIVPLLLLCVAAVLATTLLRQPANRVVRTRSPHHA